MKLRKNKLAVTVIVLSVAFLGIIIYSFKSPDKGVVEGTAGAALNPIQKVTYTLNKNIKNFVDLCLNFGTVKKENKELSKENEKLKNELLKYSNLKEENENLRKVLKFEEENNNYDYIPTNIIGYSGGNMLDGYIVDKGKNSGIEVGMIVIASDGLVGQVTSVGTNWSIIKTILNENIAVAVKINDTKENTGILKGSRLGLNEGEAKALNLPLGSAVKEGDTVVTSGLGMIYPKGIMIGKVKSVKEDKVNVMKIATIEPSVHFDKLEDLFIVSPKDKRDGIKYE